MKRVKNFSYLLIVVLFWSCNTEDGLNCFQASGDIIQQEFDVKVFEKILIRERVQLILTDGPEQKVVVETGENLMNDIIVASFNNTLSVKNDNGCNLVRDYGITKVYVTSPNISEIRNSSGLTILSDGTLSYPTLLLISEDEDNLEEYHIDGDFRLDVEVDFLQINSTGISNFFLTGTAERADFGLFNGDGRIEAQDLEVQDLKVFHRGTQKMIVNPINLIEGEIRGIADVIAVNEPPFVNVTEYYTGKLIFEERD